MLRASLESLDLKFRREISAVELVAIRELIMELTSRWGLTPTNESMELEFEWSPE